MKQTAHAKASSSERQERPRQKFRRDAIMGGMLGRKGGMSNGK